MSPFRVVYLRPFVCASSVPCAHVCVHIHVERERELLSTHLYSSGSNDRPHIKVLQSRVSLHRIEYQSLLFDHSLHLPLLLLSGPKPLLNLLDGVEHIHQTRSRTHSMGGACSVRPAGIGGGVSRGQSTVGLADTSLTKVASGFGKATPSIRPNELYVS